MMTLLSRYSYFYQRPYIFTEYITYVVYLYTIYKQ